MLSATEARLNAAKRLGAGTAAKPRWKRTALRSLTFSWLAYSAGVLEDGVEMIELPKRAQTLLTSRR